MYGGNDFGSVCENQNVKRISPLHAPRPCPVVVVGRLLLYFALLAISREDDYRHASFSIIDGNCCGIMPLNLWPNWRKIETTGPPTGKRCLAKIDRARETRLDVTDITCFVTT